MSTASCSSRYSSKVPAVDRTGNWPATSGTEATSEPDDSDDAIPLPHVRAAERQFRDTGRPEQHQDINGDDAQHQSQLMHRGVGGDGPQCQLQLVPRPSTTSESDSGSAAASAESSSSRDSAPAPNALDVDSYSNNKVRGNDNEQDVGDDEINRPTNAADTGGPERGRRYEGNVIRGDRNRQCIGKRTEYAH